MNRHRMERLTPRRASALQEKRSGPAFEGSLPPSPMMTAEGWAVESLAPISSTTETMAAATNPEARGTQGRTTTTATAAALMEEAFVHSQRELRDPLLRYLVATRRLRLQQYSIPELRDLERAAKLLLYLARQGMATQLSRSQEQEPS